MDDRDTIMPSSHRSRRLVARTAVKHFGDDDHFYIDSVDFKLPHCYGSITEAIYPMYMYACTTLYPVLTHMSSYVRPAKEKLTRR